MNMKNKYYLVVLAILTPLLLEVPSLGFLFHNSSNSQHSWFIAKNKTPCFINQFSQNQQSLNMKDLSIICNWNFQIQLETLSTNFQNLKQDQEYSLTVQYCFSNLKVKEAFKLLFKNPKPNLTSLKFVYVTLQLDQVEMFTTLKWPCLHTLKIYNSTVSNECIESITKCQILQLKSLALICCKISNLGVSHLCNAKWPKLTEIRLQTNDITSEGLEVLGFVKWGNLEQISVYGNDFSLAIEKTLGFFEFPNLRQISFGMSNLNEENLCSIVKEKLPLLQKLDVSGCPISGKALFNLQTNLGWQNLKQFCMRNESVDKESLCVGLSNFCQYEFRNLTKLFIEKTYLHKLSVKNFTKSVWNQLSDLLLIQCCQESHNIGLLSKCKWQQLKYFNISMNPISDSAISYLSQACWPLLSEAYFYENRLTNLGTLGLTKIHLQKVVFDGQLTRASCKIIKELIELD